MPKCSECGVEMGEARFIELYADFPGGEKIRGVIDDRCPKCRDEYGVCFDALSAGIELEEKGERLLLLAPS